MLFLIFYLFVLLFSFFVLFFIFVGIITLLERKILSYFHCREGPNTSFKGILQFFFDYLKLIFKFNDFSFILIISFYSVFFLFSVLLFYPVSFLGYYFNYSIIFIFYFKIIFNIFKITFCYLFFNKFVFVSTYRLKFNHLINESIELLLLSPIFYLILNFNLYSWFNYFSFFCYLDFLFLFPLFLLYFIILLYQVSRAPYDYFESENEYIGGVITSIGGNLYIIWSFIEYSEILIEVLLLSFLFFPFLTDYRFLFSLLIIFFIFLILFFRCLVPRYDYYTSFKFFSCKIFIISLIVVLFYLSIFILL